MPSSLNRVQPTLQLQPLDLVSPGFRGINTVQSGALLDPAYCTTATNAIIDTAGRLAARNGTSTVTSTPITLSVTFTATLTNTQTTATLSSPSTWTRETITTGIVTSTGQALSAVFTQGNAGVTFITPISGAATATVTVTLPILYSFEYVKGGPTYTELVTWPGGISNNLANPSGNNIAGSVNVSNGQWYFQNFNNKVVGFQSGQVPVVWSGTGNFASIAASQGSVPTSNGVGCAAFGRVWTAGTDGQTIYYSGLLDETDWGSASSGIIDMHTIWSAGTDTVTAICAFNASLVIFGTNHIIFFTDGRGSMLGLDPTQAYVFDTINSTGAFSQWTIQAIGEGDVVFLGPNGIQSIGNLQNARSYPMSNLSKYCRDQILAQVTSETSATIRSTYNNQLGQYFLCLSNNDVVWCTDLRRQYQDDVGDQCAIMTSWNMNAQAAHSTQNNVTYFARVPGTISIYGGYADDGTNYTFTYTSGWLNLGEEVSQKVKMLKRFEAIIFSGGSTEVTYSWNTDFGNSSNSAQVALNGVGASFYGLGLYGVNLYGGSTGLSIVKYDARARGQYYQVGVQATVVGAFSMQQIQLAVKIGRTA